MSFYVSIFKNSKILDISRYSDAGPGPKGQVMVGHFQLEGQQFMALNGGPHLKFTEAIAAKAKRVMQAMLQMTKIDIAKLPGRVRPEVRRNDMPERKRTFRMPAGSACSRIQPAR
jgi:predicted 3-demethylubiquinone-9 3-methyltransferase (glyoxalase superfamily)